MGGQDGAGIGVVLELTLADLKRKLRMASAGAVVFAAVAGAWSAPVFAEMCNDALSSAYRYNPQLDAERARLRATDENVPIARSGYRPQINVDADINWRHTNVRPDARRAIEWAAKGSIYPKGYTVDLVQPIFTGFQTFNAVNEAEAGVRAGRETLRGVEQDVFRDAVTAYMDVVANQAIVRERETNVNVLTRELKATEDRFSVGEVTRTDVAQSQARRALAVSDLDRARADLKTFRGTFERVVGHAPSNLIECSGYERLLPRSSRGGDCHRHPGEPCHRGRSLPRAGRALYGRQNPRSAPASRSSSRRATTNRFDIAIGMSTKSRRGSLPDG